MHNYPKVSIIIPTYNNERYIKSAISSVLNQTYPNIEIIIVDDGSKDNTSNIVESFISENVRYIPLYKNVGVSRAKNIGLKNSSGEYLAFLDSDDIYSTTKIEEQMDIFFKSEKPNLGLVYCGRTMIDENENILKELPAKGKQWNGITNGEFIGATCLIKKECLDTVGLFDPQLEYFEDMDLYYRIFKSGYSFGFTTNCLYSYRQHNCNVSKSRELVLNNIDKYYAKYMSMPEYKNDRKIKSEYYAKKSFALLKINRIKSLYYVLLSASINPFITFKFFNMLYGIYLDRKY